MIFVGTPYNFSMQIFIDLLIIPLQYYLRFFYFLSYSYICFFFKYWGVDLLLLYFLTCWLSIFFCLDLTIKRLISLIFFLAFLILSSIFNILCTYAQSIVSFHLHCQHLMVFILLFRLNKLLRNLVLSAIDSILNRSFSSFWNNYVNFIRLATNVETLSGNFSIFYFYFMPFSKPWILHSS